MKYRTIASGAARVSEIGLRLSSQGLRELFREMTAGEAVRFHHRALDLGVTVISTEPDLDHAGGVFIRSFGSRRDDLFLAVKAVPELLGFHNPEAGRPSFTPSSLRRACELALRSHRTDRLDLFQLGELRHDEVSNGALWEALRELAKEGKILVFGAALGPGAGWLYEGVDCLQQRSPMVIEHLQSVIDFYPGHELHRAAYGKLPGPEASVETLPQFQHGRMETEPLLSTRFFIRGPHSSGLLEGVFDEKTFFPADDARSVSGWLLAGLQKVRSLEFLTGKETGRTLGQAALLWLLAEPVVACCLVHSLSESQLREFALASELNPLSWEELARVAELQADNFGVARASAELPGTMARA